VNKLLLERESGERRIRRRHMAFLALCAVSSILFWGPVSALLKLSAADARYSHLGFVPFISAGLVYLDQTRIFRSLDYRPRLGIALLASSVLLRFGAALWMPPSAVLVVSILALVLAWTAAFVLCYGTRDLRAARFPLLFLLLMAPLPVALVEKISFALQVGSAEISHVLFRLAGVPVYRQGFLFTLPNTAIEVGEECSGIRSTIAMVITALLLAHLFLRSRWRKAFLVAFAAVLGVFKNAVRIVFLSSAGDYLDTDLLHSSLHHSYGGTVFSALALAILVPILILLRRRERVGASLPREAESL
jgi:exosortase